MSQDPGDARQLWLGHTDAFPSGPAAGGAPGKLPDAELRDLVAYCRGLTSREDDAVSAAHAAMDAAQSLLNDPDQLRAWLFGLARREAVADAAPPARELLDLVYRFGIQPADLPSVLGMPRVETDELLAAAQDEHGNEGSWDDRAGGDDSAYLTDSQPDPPVGELFDTQYAGLVAYCRDLTGLEDDAVRIAHAVLGLAESLLTDPDRLRAWLFALARRQMLATVAPDDREVLDLVHRHAIRAADLPIVLGITPAEANELLAVAEDNYARAAFGSGYQGADPRQGDGWPGDSRWDDRAVWDDPAFWADSPRWADDTGPTSHRFDSAGRHAAPHSGGGGIREALARGPVRAAAATGIVVAVIGVSIAYLAAADSPPPSQASHQSNQRSSPAAQSPATTPSSVPAVLPTQSTSPSQPVLVVQPAPTSPRPRPTPTPTTSSTAPPSTAPPSTAPPSTAPPSTAPPSTAPPSTAPPAG